MKLYFRSLRARIVLLTAVLFALVQWGAYYLVNLANYDNARSTIANQLEVGERFLEHLLDQRRAQLQQTARAIMHATPMSDLFGRSPQYSKAQLIDAAQRSGMTQDEFAVLVHADQSVLASPGGHMQEGASFPLPGMLLEARQHGVSSGVARAISGAYLLLAVPVEGVRASVERRPWLVVGQRLDERLVDEFRTLTQLELSLVEQSVKVSGHEHRLLLSTLGAGVQQALLAAVRQAPTHWNWSVSLTLANRVFETRRLVLVKDDGYELSAMLQQPLDSMLAVLDRSRLFLVLLACVSLPLSIGGSVWIARSITQPIKALSRAAVRIREGQYDQPIDVSGRDELGVLAQSLNHMRAGIASREAQIMRLAYEDPLTGLPNRARLMQRLQMLLAPRDDVPPMGVFLYLNLDRFQAINDTLGHASGDAVLHEVAQRLEGVVSSLVGGVIGENDSESFVARLGGDEFAVVLPGADDLRAGDVARCVIKALRPAIEVDGQPVDASVSIGVALYPADATDAGVLIQRASIAMVQAKRNNRAFAFYEASSDVAQREQLSLLGELRQAVQNSELRACYQPKIDLVTGRISGVEALVRWRHPKRGMTPPNVFMPYAEKTGFVRVITRWMLAVTLRQCGRWAADGVVLQVAVNLSARDLMAVELPQLVKALIDKYKVPPHLVCLEITESSVMEDPDRALKVLLELHGLGVKLAIDDFGTGFSSLAYLKKLPVDELKIDRTFVYRMIDDPDDYMIVRSTVELAHSLGLKVVAEGVESKACLDALRTLGCDMAQGYLFSTALRRTKLEAWLKESDWGLAHHFDQKSDAPHWSGPDSVLGNTIMPIPASSS